MMVKMLGLTPTNNTGVSKEIKGLKILSIPMSISKILSATAEILNPYCRKTLMPADSVFLTINVIVCNAL